MNTIISDLEREGATKKLPDIRPGMTVKVHQRITEGKKERVQMFEGTVIARKGGKGVRSSIVVRRIASGVGVEKQFLLQSPNVEKVEVVKTSKVRRAKLYFLRKPEHKGTKV